MLSKKVNIFVDGMTCQACSMKVEKGLAKLKIVEDVSVNLMSKTVTVSVEDGAKVEGLIGVIKRLGYKPKRDELKIEKSSIKVEDIEKAKNSLIAQKKIVKNYVGDDQAKDNLISGDSKLTCIWGGEALLAKDENKNVEFVFPKEGAIFIFDNWVIPKVSENKELAAKFIDFMSRPEISARNCNFVKYGSPIDGARELMDENLKNSDIVFPKKEVFKKGYILKDLGESNEKLQDAWTEIKAK